MASGSGTGVPAVGTSATTGVGMAGMAVTLPEYARIIGYRECAFFGIMSEDDDNFECRRIWTNLQRYDIEKYLILAQSMIEEQLGYFLLPMWTIDERHRWRAAIRAEHTRMIAGGVRSSTAIETGIVLTYATDPTEVTIALGDCAVGDVVFYFAGTEIVVYPSEVVEDEVLGTATYSFPWCRLVSPNYQDNPSVGWDYNDVATWGADELDAYCVTNDDSTEGVLIWRATNAASCNCVPGCSCVNCGDTQETACMYVRNAERSMVDLVRADYEDSAWVRKSLCSIPNWVELNYLSGLASVPRTMQDAVVRLAHSMMPTEPCGCDVTQRLWERDRNEPDVLSVERINCPFGMSDGAWMAWKLANTSRDIRGSVI